MHKKFLLAPGPTPVPERARLAMAKSLIHHRGPEFKELFAEVSEHLAWLFQTEQRVLTITASGTGTFEAALANFTSPGDTVISIGGGKFGERWGKMAAAFNMNVVQIDVEWGQAVDPDAVAEALETHPDCSMVTLTASETSTGVLHPFEDVAEVVSDSDALFAVDGITAVGVHDVPMDALGIDVLVAGSQKAFGLPPGIGFLAASDEAWRRQADTTHPKFYFDLERERNRQLGDQTAYTPGISQIVAALEVLRMMREETLEGIIGRHRIVADATRAAVTAMGLELLADRPVNSVTAVLAPEGVAGPDIVRVMRDEYDSIIAGGQAHLKPRLFRLGHIGFFERPDILMAISSLELTLRDLGYDVQPGTGMAAAQDVFSKSSHSA
jgi:aspartate aminotransferase-like enzyme